MLILICLLAAVTMTTVSTTLLPSQLIPDLFDASLSVICDSGVMKRCGAAYLASIDAPTVDTMLGLDRAIEVYEMANGGAAGFDKICGFHNAYKKCMGPTNLAACMNVTYLMNRAHWSPDAAYGLVELIGGYDYKCTPQMMKLIGKYYTCFVAATTSTVPAIKNCTKAYQKETEGHFNNHTVVCDSIGNYSLCFKAAYNIPCPTLGPLVCNIIRVEMDTVYPYCSANVCGPPLL